jgi:hypothetical protein
VRPNKDPSGRAHCVVGASGQNSKCAQSSSFIHASETVSQQHALARFHDAPRFGAYVHGDQNVTTSFNSHLRSAMAVFALSAAAFTVPYAYAAELLERAILPSATFSPGPTSGQYATGNNGVATPFIDRQAVQ